MRAAVSLGIARDDESRADGLMLSAGPLTAIGGLVLVLVAVLALREVASLVVPVVFGLFIALTAWPMVGALERRGVRHAFALGGNDGGRPCHRSRCGLRSRALGGRAGGQDSHVREPPERCPRGPARSPWAARDQRRSRRHHCDHLAGEDLRTRQARGVGRLRGRWRNVRPRLHHDLCARRRDVAPGAGGCGVR